MKKLILAASAILCGYLLPVLAHAQPPGIGTEEGMTEPLENPLGDITLQGFFLKIIEILIVFAIPIIVFFIILAGFKYVTARGNAAKIQEATSALTWAIVGGLLILGAEALLFIIRNTVDAIR